MRIDEERIKAVEKNLKEPVALQFSDQVWKIRANLIVASAIALVVGVANLQISPESSFLGIRFSGLNDILIRTNLGAIVLYLLVHFLWTGWDSFLEWRLRVTGTRSAFQTGSMWSPEHVDHPVDPRQSTLYNWWTMQQSAIGNLGAIASEFKQKLATWEKDIQAICEGKDDPHSMNLSNVLK